MLTSYVLVLLMLWKLFPNVTLFSNWITNFFFVHVSVALWLILIEIGIFPHIQRGFYCDDRSIAFKFTGDTISTALIISSIFVPFFLIWLNEAIFYKPESIKCTRLKRTLSEALFWFKQYSIGMVIHLIIIDGLKVSRK